MLKKVFFGITYLILSTIILIYLSISCSVTGFDYKVSLTEVTSFTGLPIIAIVLLIPTIILNILTLILNRRILTFCKDMVTFFASAFSFGTSIIGFFMFDAYYIPAIIAVCSFPMVILSLVEIVRTLKAGDSKDEDKEAF